MNYRARKSPIKLYLTGYLKNPIILQNFGERGGPKAGRVRYRYVSTLGGNLDTVKSHEPSFGGEKVGGGPLL